MRVLLVGQYFPPEITAGAHRLHAFAAGLARRGHRVEVVAEVPSHPAGVVAPGYGGRFSDRRSMDGFEVSYVWVRTSRSKATRARLLNYASFAASASLAGIARRQVDAVVASSPPLSVGSVGAVAATRHRVPWILDVRDLWPDAAVALGELSEGPLLRFSLRLERRLYRRAAAITTTTEPFKRTIESKGGAGKVTVIPNGTTEVFLAAGERPARRELLGEAERFVWLHAGNLGIFHGLETAVEAARLLGEDFQLLFLGEGQRRARLEKIAAELPPGTVAFRDAVPAEQAAELMRSADALLVSRADIPGLEGMVLSKLYDCCAVGRPVLVAAAGETQRVAEREGAAVCVPPEDPAALADAVRRIRDDAALRERLSQGARRFALESSRERGVEMLDRLLGKLATGSIAPMDAEDDRSSA